MLPLPRATPAGVLTSSLMANKKRRGCSMNEDQALLDSAGSLGQPRNEAQAVGDGEAELRKDSMMAHLLDSLKAGKDIGHYGRLVFAMVARHFMPHEDVLAWLLRDPDFSEADALNMLSQVEGRDYNPPKRDRLLE